MAGSKFFETANVAAAFVPVDMQTAANNGDWVSLAGYTRCVVLLFKAAGTAGDDPIFKLQQATSAAGAGAKDLTFTEIYSKVGTLTALGTFTHTSQAAATSYVDTVSAESQAIIGVEIKASDLDVNNGFGYLQLSVADIGGNAQLGCGLYLMLEPRDQGVSVPNPLV